MEEKVIQTLSRQRDSGTIVELVENEAGFRFVVSPESGGPYLPSYFSEGNTGPDTAEGLREHCPYIPFGYPGRSGWTE